MEKLPFKILGVEFLADETVILLHVPPHIRNTKQIAGFSDRCLSHHPHLKFHLCDNDKCQSFPEELKETELAHVFEHVLLDLIGEKDKEIRRIKGYTSWDWRKSERNTYEIHLHYTEKEIMSEALTDAISSFGQIFNSEATQVVE